MLEIELSTLPMLVRPATTELHSQSRFHILNAKRKVSRALCHSRLAIISLIPVPPSPGILWKAASDGAGPLPAIQGFQEWAFVVYCIYVAPLCCSGPLIGAQLFPYLVGASICLGELCCSAFFGTSWQYDMGGDREVASPNLACFTCLVTV